MKHDLGRFWGVILYLAMIALFGLVVMFLWNALLPGIFGLSIINYWQAAGLLVLARILFSGIGGEAHRAFGHKNLFRDRWDGMNNEQRDAFIRRRGHGFQQLHDKWRNMSEADREEYIRKNGNPFHYHGMENGEEPKKE
jgi:hypothetical protein